MKLNNLEMVGYASTLLQEQAEAVFQQIEQLAWDLMEETGMPESDLDEKVHADFVSGLLAKLVKRHADSEWPSATYEDEVDATLSVKEI